MRILVNSEEMKACDTCTMEQFQVPSMVLMERAALSVVEEIERQNLDRTRCLVVCGLGNNGGDGLAVARLLYLKGSQVTVVCEMKPEKATQQTKHQYEMVKQYGIPIVPALADTQHFTEAGRPFTMIIDAIFGIGLSRPVEGHWKEDIRALNQMEGDKLAVDIPSGICGEDGQVLGCAFRADVTVTFAYEKIGLLLYPGASYAGKVVRKDIGIDRHSWKGREPKTFAFEKKDLSLLPSRTQDSNKGVYGRVLVIAGKKNMAGAAYFSGKAAAFTGCGLVKLMTSESNRTILQQLIPEAILETELEEELLAQNIDWADVIVLGPGLGTGAKAEEMVKNVLRLSHKPVIVDADALNLLVEQKELLSGCPGTVIVTPHMGEMSRLTGCSVQELKKNICTAAESFAKDYNVVCVLKDTRTVTALMDGTLYINTSGNNGMATAGAGDVLTGVIAGLIAQGMKPMEAAPFGVFLHGMAGDAAAEACGCYSMISSDIIEGIRRITRKESKHEYL